MKRETAEKARELLNEIDELKRHHDAYVRLARNANYMTQTLIDTEYELRCAIAVTEDELENLKDE